MIKKDKKYLYLGFIILFLTLVVLFSILYIRDYYSINISLEATPMFTIFLILMLCGGFFYSLFLIWKSGFTNENYDRIQNPIKREKFKILYELVGDIILFSFSILGIVNSLINKEILTLALSIIIFVVSIFIGRKEYRKYQENRQYFSKYHKTDFKPKNLYELLMKDIVTDRLKSSFKKHFHKEYKFSYSTRNLDHSISLQVENEISSVTLYVRKTFNIYVVTVEKKLAGALYALYNQTHNEAFSLDVFDDDVSVDILFDPINEDKSYQEISTFFIKKINQLESIIHQFKNYTKEKEPKE